VEAVAGLASIDASPVPVWRRRRLWPVLAAAFLLAPTAALTVSAVLWLTTPAGDDLPARVASIAGVTDTAPLRPAEVPEVLAQAIIAVEDERFEVHHGLDTVGTARAALHDLASRCLCEGGSTITQQLAKLVYYPDDSRVARKLPVMAVAYKLELHYGKPQIMAAYLSVVPTGFDLTGARAGACAYFGHPLSQLTVAEAAQLAGGVQAPSAYDPRSHPERARARRAYALERMAQVGFVTEQQALAGMLAPLTAGTGRC
jgi:membrane peptidoglycan carboxypeptidase